MIEGTFEMVLRSSNVRNFRNSIERIYYSKCVISKSVSLNASWFIRSHYIRLLYSIDSSYLDNWFNFYNLHSLSNFLSMQEYSIFPFDSFQTLPKNRYEKIVFRGKKRWSSEKRRSTEIRFDPGMFRSSPPCLWARWRWVPVVSRPVALPHLVGFARLPPRTRRKLSRRTRTKPRQCFSPPTCRNRGCDEFGVWNPCSASSCISCSPRRMRKWSWPAATGWSRYPVWKSATSSRYRRSWTWKKARCF